MEIIESTDRKIVIQLTEYEYKQIKVFCNVVFLDLESLIHLFFRSLYNFVVQYLLTRGFDGK